MPNPTKQSLVPLTPWVGQTPGSGTVPLVVPAGYDFWCWSASFCFNYGVGQVMTLTDSGGKIWFQQVCSSNDHPEEGSLTKALNLVFPGGAAYTLSVAPGQATYSFTGAYLAPTGASIL